MPRSADFTWLCCGPTQGALLPTSSAGARPHQHRDKSAARPPRGLYHRVRAPWRASRALFDPWKFGRTPTEHAPRSADLAWLCCGPTLARSSPCQRPGLVRTNTVTGRRHGVWEVLTTAFESRGTRRVRFTARGKSADRPRSTRRAARTWRGCVVGQRRARFTPHRRPGLDHTNTATGRRHSTQEVLITAFGSMARVACALCPVESRPTAHRARSAQRGLGVVVLRVVGQRGARSSPRRRPGLDRIKTATGRRYGLQEVFVAAFEFHGARRARSLPRG